MRNFTLNTAACNRLHAFPWSVRVGCLISACNVRAILARKLDIFIHFVRYCCCLNMLDSGSALALHGGPAWLRVRLVQVPPTGLLIFAMLRLHRLHDSIVTGVAISQDFTQGTKLFFLFVSVALIYG